MKFNKMIIKITSVSERIVKFMIKNWIPIAFMILFFTLLIDKSCDESAFKKDIKVLDDEITILDKKNAELKDEAYDYITDALKQEEIVRKQEKEIEVSRVIIAELREERLKVDDIVAALPPSRLIDDLREILDCAEIEFKDGGVFFSEQCARSNLSKLKKFSLIKRELDETIFSLTRTTAALRAQQLASWNLYGALWKMGDQIINLKKIEKLKDQKYERSEKQRRKSWLNGLYVGLTFGAGITIIIAIIIPMIRLIF